MHIMSTYEEIKENLMAQVCELETLQSVYPKELVIADHGVLADINDFIKKPMEELPQKLDYSIEISLSNGNVELLVALSYNYPKEKPEVYARSSSLNRIQQLLLNESLNRVVENEVRGEPCIYTLISWLQDNSEDYLAASNTNIEWKTQNENVNREREKCSTFARYWIRSHHIYGKEKRKEIVSCAKENNLTGFCLAGKPGIICVEGTFENCEYYWQKIKSLNWHKILIKLLEKQEDCDNIDAMRKFNDIQEISFPSSERHNDMGLLLKYLIEHDSQHAFKELFGLEGKTVELN